MKKLTIPVRNLRRLFLNVSKGFIIDSAAIMLFLY